MDISVSKVVEFPGVGLGGLRTINFGLNGAIKIDFQDQFTMSKIIGIFLIFCLRILD